MIIIGPGIGLLILLCMFKPIRFVVGWILFLVMAALLATCIYTVNT